MESSYCLKNIALIALKSKAKWQFVPVLTLIFDGKMDTIEPMSATSVEQAYAYCQEITRKHYENFPVASLFIPKDQRLDLSSIYAFARLADDMADEGSHPAATRLRMLDDWEQKLDQCYAGKSDHPVFIALAETVDRTGIPKKSLADLLTAFRMDVTQRRLASFQDLLHYCKHSANPVGHLVLYVFHNATERTLALSDNICTALQLTNFWQDVRVDWQKGRVYLPLEDLARFGYTEHDLENDVCDDRFRSLMRFEVERTRQLFEAGKPLIGEVTKKFRFQLRLTLTGGMTILKKIEDARYDVFTRLPRLSPLDLAGIFLKSIAGAP